MIWLARSCFSAVLLVWAVLASSVPLSAVAQEPGTQEPGTQQSNSASSTPKSASTGAIEQLSPATNVSPTVPASQTDAPIPPVATGAPAAAGLVPTAGVQGTGSEAEASDDLTPEQYREELLKDPEYVAELDKRAAAYKKSRANLVKAVGDQRETFVRYLNHDVRTPAARQLFFEQREVVQNRLDDHYNTALALTMMGEYNEDAITFLVTMIQHRFENSIYDIATLQGATFLMDNNSQLEYI